MLTLMPVASVSRRNVRMLALTSSTRARTTLCSDCRDDVISRRHERMATMPVPGCLREGCVRGRVARGPSSLRGQSWTCWRGGYVGRDTGNDSEKWRRCGGNAMGTADTGVAFVKSFGGRMCVACEVERRWDGEVCVRVVCWSPWVLRNGQYQDAEAEGEDNTQYTTQKKASKTDHVFISKIEDSIIVCKSGTY